MLSNEDVIVALCPLPQPNLLESIYAFPTLYAAAKGLVEVQECARAAFARIVLAHRPAPRHKAPLDGIVVASNERYEFDRPLQSLVE